MEFVTFFKTTCFVEFLIEIYVSEKNTFDYFAAIRWGS